MAHPPLYGPPHVSEVFMAHGVEQRDDGPRTGAGFKPSPPQHSAVMWREGTHAGERKWYKRGSVERFLLCTLWTCIYSFNQNIIIQVQKIKEEVNFIGVIGPGIPLLQLGCAIRSPLPLTVPK